MSHTILTLLFLLLIPINTVVYGYNIFLRPGTEQCFTERLQKNDKLLASFAVSSGGHLGMYVIQTTVQSLYHCTNLIKYMYIISYTLDIDCKVYGPDSKLVYQSERRMTDNFQFYAQQPGEYRICFANSMSTITGKTISFHIYAGTKLASMEAAKNIHLSPLESSIVSLSEGVQAVTDTTEYMKIRERVCSATNISTGRRVIGWNIFKSICVIGTTLISVFYMKQLFEKNRTV